MFKAIIIAGFGGQGILLAGKVIALAAMYQGKEVTWISSYGPEMRGGIASSTVIISDEEIGSPLVKYPDIAIVLNQPSFDKYESLVIKNGLLIINSSLVCNIEKRTDITYFYIPANKLALELGNIRVVNMIMINRLNYIFSSEYIEKALSECFSDKKLVELNKKAFDLIVKEERQQNAKINNGQSK